MRFLTFFFLFTLNAYSAEINEHLLGPLKELEKQISDSNASQFGLIEKGRDILDLIDQQEKREAAFTKLKTAFEKDLWTFNWVLPLVNTFLKLCAVYLFYFLMRRFVVRMLDYQMEFMANRRDRVQSNPTKAKISRAIVEETIAPLFQKIATWVLRIIAGTFALDIFGANILPLALSFSFLGLAVTLASKSMVTDLLNGIMTLMQGVVAVGEVVKIGESKGIVEDISLRAIVLRLSNGELEIVPFSSINKIVNYSRDFTISRSEVVVSFKEDIARVEQCFQDALVRLLADQNLSASLVDKKLRFYGVVEFSEYGYRVAASIKTTPDPFHRIGYRFNQIVQDEMRKQGIHFPSLEYGNKNHLSIEA